MRRRALTVRAIALLAAGSAAVHQLRYVIGYGPRAGHELATQGHTYLGVALPLVAATTIIALAAALMRLAGGTRAGDRRRVHWLALWAAATAALALIYITQETAEGLIATGHPSGLAAFAGGGAWLGLALSVPAGLLMALALRGFAAAPEALARRTPRPLARAVAPARLIVPALLPLARVVASGLGARAPPAASVG